MFNVRKLIAALRLCVVGVLCLGLPMSHALPGSDVRLVAPAEAGAVSPVPWEVPQAAAAQMCSVPPPPPHGSIECVNGCDTAYDNCMKEADGTWSRYAAMRRTEAGRLQLQGAQRGANHALSQA